MIVRKPPDSVAEAPGEASGVAPSGPSQKIRAAMEQAAALRATGKTWGQVAHILKVGERTCKRWPNQYPEAWEDAFGRSSGRVLGRIIDLGMAALEDQAKLRDTLKKQKGIEAKRLRQSCNHSLSAIMARVLPTETFIHQDSEAMTYETAMAKFAETKRALQQREQQREQRGTGNDEASS